MIRFHDRYFVAINPAGLGYSVPIEGENTQAFKQRKENAVSWAGQRTYNHKTKSYHTKPHTELTIDNKPISGISMGKSVSRWTTDNKWFRVSDPRGFELEISAANLAELIANTVMDHGTIKDELVWGRAGNSVYLAKADHEDYLRFLNPVNREPTVGEYFLDDKGNARVYLGKAFAHGIKFYQGKRYKQTSGGYWSRAPREMETYIEREQTLDEKPWHIYATGFSDYSDSHSIEMRRSKSKVSEIPSEAPDWVDTIPNVFDGKFRNIDQYNGSYWFRYALHEDKKSLKAVTPLSNEELDKTYKRCEEADKLRRELAQERREKARAAA